MEMLATSLNLGIARLVINVQVAEQRNATVGLNQSAAGMGLINGDASNITIQSSIIAQGLETHSCGGLIQTDGGVSLFRNLYIDNKTRNPKVKGVNEFTNDH
jgi:hypothetical protein